MIDAFSRRRTQIVERMAEQQTSGFHAAKVAAVATRERKEPLDLPRLREEWAARAAEHGLGQHELRRLIGRTPLCEPTPAELLATAERLLGPEGLTEKRTVFAEPGLAMGWAQAHRQGASVARIRELSGRLLTIGGVQRLSEPTPGRPAHYSTLELLELERSALELVKRGRDVDLPVLPPAILDEAVHELSAEQEAMVRASPQATNESSVSSVPPARQDNRHARCRRGFPGQRCAGRRCRPVRDRRGAAPGRDRHSLPDSSPPTRGGEPFGRAP